MKTLLALLLLIPSLSFNFPTAFADSDDYWTKKGLKEGPEIKSGSLERSSNMIHCYDCHYGNYKADVIRFIPDGKGYYRNTKWKIYLKGNFKYEVDPILRKNNFEVAGKFQDFFEAGRVPKRSLVKTDGFEFQTDNWFYTLSELDEYISNKLVTLKREESINRIKNTCLDFGFVKGTDTYQQCILQVMNTEQQLLILESQIRLSNSKETNIYNLMQNDVIEKQLQLQNGIELLRLGEEILNKDTTSPNINLPPIRCITNPVGWSCM